MKRRLLIPLLLLVPVAVACDVRGRDPGPMDTSTEQVALGGAESVRVSLNMGAGESRVGAGASGLLDASFHYSRNLGRPVVRYDVENSAGRLVIEEAQVPNAVISNRRVNDWFLKFNERTPLEFDVRLGAGETTLDLAGLTVRRVAVRVGAGQLTLTLGRVDRDMSVDISGGVGEAVIKLPADQSVAARATGGIGSIETKNLDRGDDGRYYSRAFDAAKPTITIDARGGVGTIRMEADE
jgi:hypothetical protein